MSILSKSVLVGVVCLSLVVLAGCGGGGNGVSGEGAGGDWCPECPSSWAAPQGDPVPVSGYSITYMGSYYDRWDDETTFCYLVEGNGEPPGLSHFVVGLPECIAWEDIVAYSPDGDVVFSNPDPTTGVRGLKYDSGLATDGSQMYCFTLDGYYAEGTIVVGVKAGQLEETAELTGPACETD